MRSTRGRAKGSTDKGKRRRFDEEDVAEATSLKTTLPLPLLCVVKSHLGTLVWLQLCNPQGITLFSFVHLGPRVPRPFAGASVYGMSLRNEDRLRVVGCGFKGRLVRLLSLGVGLHFEPQRNWNACRKMMQMNVRRLAAGLAECFVRAAKVTLVSAAALLLMQRFAGAFVAIVPAGPALVFKYGRCVIRICFGPNIVES